MRPLGHVSDGVAAEVLDALRFELDGMPTPKATFGQVKGGSWLRVPILGLDELRDVVFESTMPIVPVNHPKSMPWEVAIPLRKDRTPRELAAPLSGSWTVSDVVVSAGLRLSGGYCYETFATIPLG